MTDTKEPESASPATGPNGSDPGSGAESPGSSSPRRLEQDHDPSKVSATLGTGQATETVEEEKMKKKGGDSSFTFFLVRTLFSLTNSSLHELILSASLHLQ